MVEAPSMARSSQKGEVMSVVTVNGESRYIRNYCRSNMNEQRDTPNIFIDGFFWPTDKQP